MKWQHARVVLRNTGLWLTLTPSFFTWAACQFVQSLIRDRKSLLSKNASITPIFAEPCKLSVDHGISNDSRLSEQALVHFPRVELVIYQPHYTLPLEVQHSSLSLKAPCSPEVFAFYFVPVKVVWTAQCLQLIGLELYRVMLCYIEFLLSNCPSKDSTVSN